MTPRRAAVCGSPLLGCRLRRGSDRHLVATCLKVRLTLKGTSGGIPAGLLARRPHGRHQWRLSAQPCRGPSWWEGAGHSTHVWGRVFHMHVLLRKTEMAAGLGALHTVLSKPSGPRFPDSRFSATFVSIPRRVSVWKDTASVASGPFVTA